VVKSCGAERLGKGSSRDYQVLIKELNESEPLMRCREEVSPVKTCEVEYGVKSNIGNNINYSDNLFIFCKAGVIQMARTLFGLIYGTWEAAYKCKGKCTIRTT